MKQLLLDIQPSAHPSFDNFLTGRNGEAIQSLRQAVNSEAGGHFIYLWGASGSGKSHLLIAVAHCSITVFDDVHLLDEAAQINLFNTYNHIKQCNGTLICAGLHAPTQMGLRDDLATRLAWGLVYQLHALSDQEKVTALQNHARERGMKLPDEVLYYCLRHLRRDLPTLMSVLDALDKWSLTEKKPVTVTVLKKLLQLNLGL